LALGGLGLQARRTAVPQSRRIHRYLRHGTLPQLAVFEASARLRSFTRAALELHVAQPTVSAQIRKLTETVGAPLFEQIGKQIHLTETGRRTYACCEAIFRTLGTFDDGLGELHNLATGRLSLAVGPACEPFATRMLAGFGSRHPGIAIVLRIHNRSALIERLANNDDDLYILASAPADREVVRQAIVDNPLVVFAHPGNPLVHARSITLERLAEEPFLMREPGSGTRETVLQAFDRRGLAPRVQMELPSDAAIRRAIAADRGISILPRTTWSESGDGTTLAMLDVVGFPLPRQWQFVYPIGRHVTRAMQAFIDFVRAQTRAAD
jgi:LysR family transcriptional regulator, low CO2-responsive transcriptional regulator